MFHQNHNFACAANFVGFGDCDDINDCLALLANEGKKFNVTVEYHTAQTYYPGFPVSRFDGSGIEATFDTTE